jgi:hypothetical protein
MPVFVDGRIKSGHDDLHQPRSTSRIVVPIAAGDSATTTPAPRNA